MRAGRGRDCRGNFVTLWGQIIVHMEIIINGEKTTTRARTLAELVDERRLAPAGLAIAVGSRVVPREQWPSAPLAEGSVVTLIRATQGG